jgi:hypothetical protein
MERIEGGGGFVCMRVWLGKSTTKTHETLCQAFGEHSSNQTVVFEWRLLFKAGQVSVEDVKRLGQPSTIQTTENVECSLSLCSS